MAARQPFVHVCPARCYNVYVPLPQPHTIRADDLESAVESRGTPSPPHTKAGDSAKLAAMHARLSLSRDIPLQTLARALIHPSADPNPDFNNLNLAYLGSTIINYHVVEYLVCKWPRLPAHVLYDALGAYAANESLQLVARQWGVELAAYPGEEVDPGLLQWRPEPECMVNTRWGFVRPDLRRNASPPTSRYMERKQRVVLDRHYGTSMAPVSAEEEYQGMRNEAMASFVQAVVGSIYAHCGREDAKTFIKSHILSRQLDPSALFSFQLPTRELALLCAREGWKAPLARLESETGRRSRTPVFVVGIYSGQEKIGEDSGPSLDIARRKACMMALKAWYLYSPANRVRVPSDTMSDTKEPWKAPYIDIGHII